MTDYSDWAGYQMQHRFENSETTEEDRVEILKELQKRAERDLGGSLRKCNDGEVIFRADYTKALIPGHIYSELGARDYYIHGYCEYHFDKMNGKLDKEDD